MFVGHKQSQYQRYDAIVFVLYSAAFATYVP